MNTKEWEKEFDRQCLYSEPYNGIGCCGGDYCSGDHNERIKDFIKSLLSSHTQEIREKVEKEIIKSNNNVEFSESESERHYYIGRKSFGEDVLQILESNE